MSVLSTSRVIHIKKVLDYITQQKKQKSRVLFSVESEGRRESLLTLLKPTGLKLTPFKRIGDFIACDADVGIIVTPLATSVRVQETRSLSIITEQELLGVKNFTKNAAESINMNKVKMH